MCLVLISGLLVLGGCANKKLMVYPITGEDISISEDGKHVTFSMKYFNEVIKAKLGEW